MIFSLFRNGKEVKDEERFRVETDEKLFTFVEMEIWALFVQKHLAFGGIINDETKFIDEAKSMGYSVEPVIS